MSDQDLRKDYDSAYNTAIKEWQLWLRNARRAIRFRLGDQYSADEKARLALEMRDPLVFNKTRRLVKLLTGYQRKNRLAMKVDAIEGADSNTARQFSGVLQFEMTKKSGYQIMSDAFEHGPVTCGMNLVEIYLDYSEDPVHGDLQLRRIPYNRALLDPYFTRPDLSDCSYILRRDWLGKADLKALLPERAKDIDQMRPKGRDSKYPHYSPNQDFRGDNLYRVDYFYRRDTAPAKLLIDRLTGQFRVWSGNAKQLDTFLMSPDQETGVNFGQRVQVEAHQRQVVNLGLLVEDITMYDDFDPLGIDAYPFVPLLGEWVPEYDYMQDKLQGVVQCIIDPQREVNRRRLKALDIMDSVIATGFKAKEGSVVSKNALYQTGQSRVVWIKNEASLADVEQFQGAEVPQGVFRLMEVLEKDVLDIPGLEGLISMPEGGKVDIPYLLAKLRESQGLTQNQDLFDNLRDAKKLLGNKLIRAVQVNYGPEKIQRILNEKPTPEFYTKDFGKYDCTPTEGILTDTQRQMYHAQLLQYKEMGAPISWKMIFESSPLELKDEVKQAIEGAEKKAQMEGQLDSLIKQVTAKLLQAESAAKTAQAQERTAKIGADRARAGLDLAKASAEIENMSAERLMKIMTMVLDIERQGGLGLPGLPGPEGSQPSNVVPLQKRGEMVTRR